MKLFIILFLTITNISIYAQDIRSDYLIVDMRLIFSDENEKYQVYLTKKGLLGNFVLREISTNQFYDLGQINFHTIQFISIDEYKAMIFISIKYGDLSILTTFSSRSGKKLWEITDRKDLNTFDDQFICIKESTSNYIITGLKNKGEALLLDLNGNTVWKKKVMDNLDSISFTNSGDIICCGNDYSVGSYAAKLYDMEGNQLVIMDGFQENFDLDSRYNFFLNYGGIHNAIVLYNFETQSLKSIYLFYKPLKVVFSYKLNLLDVYYFIGSEMQKITFNKDFIVTTEIEY